MPDTLIDEKKGFDTCPACDSDNIFGDLDGWYYCNDCGEVWKKEYEL